MFVEMDHFFETDPFMEKHIVFLEIYYFFEKVVSLEVRIIFGDYLLKSETVLGEKKNFLE